MGEAGRKGAGQGYSAACCQVLAWSMVWNGGGGKGVFSLLPLLHCPPPFVLRNVLGGSLRESREKGQAVHTGLDWGAQEGGT